MSSPPGPATLLQSFILLVGMPWLFCPRYPPWTQHFMCVLTRGWLRAEPRSSRDKVIAHSAMSVGYGREVGVIMLIYIMAFAYAACSPIILPFTLCYFTSVWVRASITHEGIRKHVMRAVHIEDRHFLQISDGAYQQSAFSDTLHSIASNLAAAIEPHLCGSQHEAWGLCTEGYVCGMCAGTVAVHGAVHDRALLREWRPRVGPGL